MATDTGSPSGIVAAVRWKQAVADRVLSIVNRKGTTDFVLEEVYTFSQQLAEMFPRNRHVEAKIRQVLQQLRDDGLLTFQGAGRYSVDENHPEVAIDLSQLGSAEPGNVASSRRIRLRSTLLALELKRQYKWECQVCRRPIVFSQLTLYAEAHHLKPLGGPHRGPDLFGNILVLCPNHHVMFDRGAVMVEPASLLVRHRVPSVFPGGQRLYVKPWHQLDEPCLVYHRDEIYCKARFEPTV